MQTKGESTISRFRKVKGQPAVVQPSELGYVDNLMFCRPKVRFSGESVELAGAEIAEFWKQGGMLDGSFLK